MQKCRKCNEKLSWNKKYRVLNSWKNKHFHCDKCGSTYCISNSKRANCNFISLLIAMTFVNYLPPFNYFYLNFIVVIPTVNLLLPFFVKFDHSK